MAIAPKPVRKPRAESDIDAFIGAAGGEPAVAPTSASVEAVAGPKRGRKVPVMLRLDEKLLARIDGAAAHSYQSRTAWIAGNLARILDESGF